MHSELTGKESKQDLAALRTCSRADSMARPVVPVPSEAEGSGVESMAQSPHDSIPLQSLQIPAHKPCGRMVVSENLPKYS